MVPFYSYFACGQLKCQKIYNYRGPEVAIAIMIGWSCIHWGVMLNVNFHLPLKS